METDWTLALGGRFASVRDLVRQTPRLATQYQRLEWRLGKVHVARYGSKNTAPDRPIDRFVARVLLGLLQRGDASIVSPFLERAVLESFDIEYEAAKDDSSINFNLVSSAGVYAEQLFSALGSGNYELITAHGTFDSFYERAFYSSFLQPHLGEAIGFVDRQRPLSSMISASEDGQTWIDQRVDFALETPAGLKIVFEIDGSQHKGFEQKQADRIRDQALTKAGWRVQRVSTESMRLGSQLVPLALMNLIQKDTSIHLVKEGPLDEVHEVLAQWPHLVNRIQASVLLALYSGDLSLEMGTWNLAIACTDRRVIQLAVEDFQRTLTEFCLLYGIGPVPKVSLFAVGDEDNSGSPTLANQDVVTIDLAREHLNLSLIDLYIDVSLAPSGTLSASDSLSSVDSHHVPVSTPSYIVRTAIAFQDSDELPWEPARPIVRPWATAHPLGYFLMTLFRREEFRSMQREIIERAMSRQDVIGLLPTGGGKSLTFQMATLLSSGVAVVVTPLKSLIDDQVYNLHSLGINRVVGIHSGQDASTKTQVLGTIAKGATRFIYISPERFQSLSFREELSSSRLHGSVAFSVIDEAHCVSEWGHQFRPAYLMVGKHARDMFAAPGQHIPLMALTATASTTVLEDIQRDLGFDVQTNDSIVEVESHMRENLKYVPIHLPDQQKREGLSTAISATAQILKIAEGELLVDGTTAGLVFCRHVNGEFGVTGIHTALAAQYGEKAVRYYAGSSPQNGPEDREWEKHKSEVQSQFKKNQFPLLVTTAAFGMGIDKSEIRYTIHYGIPDSIEALVQESGRCGRDKRDAVCSVIYSPATDAEYVYRPELDAEEVRKQIGGWDNPSDAKRVLYLNSVTYPGEQVELRSLIRTFQLIYETWQAKGTVPGKGVPVAIKSRGGKGTSMEKDVYRLSVLGIVTDYTVDWNSRVIFASTMRPTNLSLVNNLKQYLSRYRKADDARLSSLLEIENQTELDAFVSVARQLLGFIYETMERNRRQSLTNLVQFLDTAGADGNVLRNSLVEFLTKNDFTAFARTVSQAENDGAWFRVFDRVQYDTDRRELMLAVQRQLETEATHPGLRLIYLITASPEDEISVEQVVQELHTVVADYRQLSSRTNEDLALLLVRTAEKLSTYGSQKFDEIVLQASVHDWSEPFLEAAHPMVKSAEARAVCALPALRRILSRSASLFMELEEGVA